MSVSECQFVHICVPCLWGPEEALYLLESELQVVVSSLTWVLGIELSTQLFCNGSVCS